MFNKNWTSEWMSRVSANLTTLGTAHNLNDSLMLIKTKSEIMKAMPM